MSNAQLIISQPGQRTRRVEVTSRLVSIGRRADNTIPLEDDTNVSKYHAVIELRADGFWLSDLGSSNGTTVNDEPVRTERMLFDGDLICVGGLSTVEFRAPLGAAGNAPAAPAHADAHATAPPPPPPRPAPPISTPDTNSASGAASMSAGASPAASPAPPASPASGGKSGLLIAGIVLGSLLLVAALVGVLYATGVIGGSKASGREAARGESVSSSAASNDTSATGGTGETSDSGAGGSSSGDGEQSSAVTPAASQAASAAPVADEPALPAASTGGAADTDALANMARTLSVQLSQKSAYRFDPNFIALVKSYTNEYRAAAGYYERARKYRDAVDKEFVNVQGIQPPLIGYVMAMSRSKFIERADAGGVWGLTPAVTRASAGGASVDLSDPAVSTRAAAAHLKDLLDLFGREQFVYAVACYGMTLDEAGKVKTELEQKDPGGQLRYDFWRMKNLGLVRGEQVERVARFFAAGIVCENPQQFNLKDKPLSALYD